MSSEQENKQFIFSTLEYLNNLYESNNELVLNKEKLKQGIQSLEEAFGLELSNDQHQNGYSLHTTNPNLSMSKLISTHIEFQTLGNHSDLKEIDPNLVVKFEQYVLKLHSTPYFKDIEKGSKQYNQRLIKAKEKFLKKYSTVKKPETQTTNEPPKQEFVEPKKVVTEEDKKNAEQWKNKGNDLFKEGKYEESIHCYTKAIEINETAIYYSNRAAAFQHLKKFQNIVDDCKRAIEIDPKYTKSYLRISSAFESLGKYEDAIVYYELLLNIEPNNQPAAEALQNARNKLKEKQPNMDFSSFLNDNSLRDLANNIQKKKEESPNEMPQTETPSFEDILSNPHILNMAQEAMKNNNFQQYLSNPNFMNMAQQMLSNPSQLNQFMSNLGGMGGMGGMGGQSNPPQDPNNNNN